MSGRAGRGGVGLEWGPGWRVGEAVGFRGLKPEAILQSQTGAWSQDATGLTSRGRSKDRASKPEGDISHPSRGGQEGQAEGNAGPWVLSQAQEGAGQLFPLPQTGKQGDLSSEDRGQENSRDLPQTELSPSLSSLASSDGLSCP